MNKNKWAQLLLNRTFLLASLLIIVDFVLPGKRSEDEIVHLRKERQQYYNAARNFHYSYKVITSKHEFYVTEDFASLELEAGRIEYAVSPIFKEVNWYRLPDAENRSYYSLRFLSGLVLPFMVLGVMLMALRYKKSIGTIVFVLQSLLFADLIYLIM